MSTISVGDRSAQIQNRIGLAPFRKRNSRRTHYLSADNGSTETTYNYDANGNRSGGSYDVGNGNRLAADATWSYSYDNEGNLTKKVNITEGEDAGITWTYAYDNANHLIQAKKWSEDPEIPESEPTLLLQADYVYDAFGNRIEKIVDWDGEGEDPAEVSKFAYDGWNNVKPAPVGNENWDVFAELDDNGDLVTRNLHGDAADQFFARVAANGDTLWNLTDHLGSIRDIIDNDGLVKDQIFYDGFGNITYESDPEFGGRYKWTSREFDAETNLQYNRRRYYDADTGRWISQDPLGFDAGDSNLYRYVNNRPTQNTDPSGKIIIADNHDEAVHLLEDLIAAGALRSKVRELPSGKWYVHTDSGNGLALFKYADSKWAEVFNKSFKLKDPSGWEKAANERNYFLLAAGGLGEIHSNQSVVKYKAWNSTPNLSKADSAAIKKYRDAFLKGLDTKIGADLGGVDRYTTLPGGFVVNINSSPYYGSTKVKNFFFGDATNLILVESKSFDNLWTENVTIDTDWAQEMLRIGKPGALATIYGFRKAIPGIQKIFSDLSPGLSFSSLGDYLSTGIGFGFSFKIP